MKTGLILKNPTFPFLSSNLFNDIFDTELSFVSETGKTNVSETTDKYNVEILLPGTTKDKISVNVENGILKIENNVENENENESTEENFTRREWRRSHFSKQFSLPKNADSNSVNASYENGVLKIAIAKSKELKGRTVEIK